MDDMNSMVPAARLEHVRFSYDNGVTWVLDGIDLTIRSGERLCLVGPNGSGKSTLARLIAGLAAPDGGDMTLLGHHVFDGETASANPSEYRDARHGIGTVFQNPEDQIVTTIVEDDVAFGPENLGVARDDIGGRIDESLQSVDMAGFRHADPTRMSGGQQQRIAIAGMLAMNPRMLVLDEPTAMLDPDARIEVMRILDMLQRRGTTIVLVTHHHDETMHADRVLRIDGGLLTQVEADRDAIAAKQVIARSHADATDAAGSTESAAEEPGGSTAAASPAQPAKSGQPVKPASTKSDASPIPPTGSTSDAIAVSGLSYRYDDGDAPVFENLSSARRRRRNRGADGCQRRRQDHTRTSAVRLGPPVRRIDHRGRIAGRVVETRETASRTHPKRTRGPAAQRRLCHAASGASAVR